jgi:ribosomal protein L37AE/L43A
LLHEFYILNAKLSGVQKANGTADVDSDVVPRQIQKRLEQIIPRIKQFQTEFTETDIQEILQVITRHKEYLTEPDHGVEQANTSKHRPDSCPTCNLSWGADHGNELGNGYTSIGAGVWKCSRCDNLIHGLHDSNQRVL